MEECEETREKVIRTGVQGSGYECAWTYIHVYVYFIISQRAQREREINQRAARV